MRDTSQKRLRFIFCRDGMILLIGLLYAAVVVNTGFFIPCAFKKITGLNCPGCGISRACVALLQGKLSVAVGYNPFLFAVAPVLAYLVIRSDYRYVRQGSSTLSKADTIVAWLCIIAAVLFGIVRNL